MDGPSVFVLAGSTPTGRPRPATRTYTSDAFQARALCPRLRSIPVNGKRSPIMIPGATPTRAPSRQQRGVVLHMPPFLANIRGVLRRVPE